MFKNRQKWISISYHISTTFLKSWIVSNVKLAKFMENFKLLALVSRGIHWYILKIDIASALKILFAEKFTGQNEIHLKRNELIVNSFLIVKKLKLIRRHWWWHFINFRLHYHTLIECLKRDIVKQVECLREYHCVWRYFWWCSKFSTRCTNPRPKN